MTAINVSSCFEMLPGDFSCPHPSLSHTQREVKLWNIGSSAVPKFGLCPRGGILGCLSPFLWPFLGKGRTDAGTGYLCVDPTVTIKAYGSSSGLALWATQSSALTKAWHILGVQTPRLPHPCLLSQKTPATVVSPAVTQAINLALCLHNQFSK